MLRTRVKGGVGALIYGSDSEESEVRSDFYSLPFCPQAVTSTDLRQESEDISCDGNPNCEVATEVSHSEGEVDDVTFLASETSFAEELLQPLPLVSSDSTQVSSLWDSVGTFPGSDLIPEQDSTSYYSPPPPLRSYENSCSLPDQQFSSVPQIQYTIVDNSPFEPVEYSSQPTAFDPPRPSVDFAGRTFQCMEDHHIRAYERALHKRYIS